LKTFIKPLRERRKEIAQDLNFVNKVLAEGKEKAQAIAGAKMEQVKKAIGVI
jgi:tryptophanyl-tRNA synthetase